MFIYSAGAERNHSLPQAPAPALLSSYIFATLPSCSPAIGPLAPIGRRGILKRHTKNAHAHLAPAGMPLHKRAHKGDKISIEHVNFLIALLDWPKLAA